MIKLIASDMDGTLLNNQHRISKKNLEAIKIAKKNNIDFIIATGRAYYEAIAPLKKVNLKCELICYNGGITYDLDGNIVNIEKLTEENAKFIINIFKKFELTYQLYTQKCTYTTNINTDIQTFIDLIESHNAIADKEKITKEVLERQKKGHIVEVKDIDSYIKEKDNPLIKIICISNDKNKLKKVTDLLKNNKELNVTSSGENNIEVMPKNASKGLALKNLTDAKNIPLEETLAIGDNLNDLSMLEIVKHSVAMKNSNEKLKEKAKYITKNTNDNDGVGEFIINFIQKLNGETND